MRVRILLTSWVQEAGDPDRRGDQPREHRDRHHGRHERQRQRVLGHSHHVLCRQMERA